MIPDPNSSIPDEPLADSAAIGWTIGPLLCPGDPDSADACVWYHRVWQYLRLFGLITSIRTNTHFLVETFGRLASAHPRVLISGSADYGMLAHLVHAYKGRPLDVTVVDLCPTTLHLNAWYADRHGCDVQTVQSDVLEFTSRIPFDLVCTHNFLGRFDGPARHRLISRWHALLRPGGVAVTTQRIRPDGEGAIAHYTPGAARALGARVAAAAATYRHPLPATPAELGRAAYEYARRKGGHVIRSTHEVADVFQASGFDVDLVDEGGGSAERDGDRPSSMAGKDTYRMRLVATRR